MEAPGEGEGEGKGDENESIKAILWSDWLYFYRNEFKVQQQQWCIDSGFSIE